MVSTPLSTIFQLYRGGVLLEETAVPGENQTCHRQTLSHIVASTSLSWREQVVFDEMLMMSTLY